MNLEESGTRVHQIRKTQNGSVLIELEAIEDRQKLEEAVKAVTGPESNVRDMIPILIPRPAPSQHFQSQRHDEPDGRGGPT